MEARDSSNATKTTRKLQTRQNESDITVQSGFQPHEQIDRKTVNGSRRKE